MVPLFLWSITWCTIPEPGGTTSMLRKAFDPHLRKANLSLFLWNSSSIFAWTAFSDLATSTWTEWSITRSTGTCKPTQHIGIRHRSTTIHIPSYPFSTHFFPMLIKVTSNSVKNSYQFRRNDNVGSFLIASSKFMDTPHYLATCSLLYLSKNSLGISRASRLGVWGLNKAKEQDLVAN